MLIYAVKSFLPFLPPSSSSSSSSSSSFSSSLLLLCRAGKKLAVYRSLVEAQLLFSCAQRPSLSAHYQFPLMQGFLSPTHPPIFAHNLERPLGSTHITVGQLSLNSLLPITLKSDPTSSQLSPDRGEVDTRSCIFTILELYQHWLTEPLSILLLQHILASIIMLSDLFVLSNQYEWMLGTFLSLLDHLPPEDVCSQALLVLGVIKAAAVLRVVSILGYTEVHWGVQESAVWFCSCTG